MSHINHYDVRNKLLKLSSLFGKDDSMKRFIEEPYVDMLLNAFSDSLNIIDNKISCSNYMFNRRILKQIFKFLFLPKPSVSLVQVASMSDKISFNLPEYSEFYVIDGGSKFVYTSVMNVDLCSLVLVGSCFSSADSLDLVKVKGNFVQLFFMVKNGVCSLYGHCIDIYVNHDQSSRIVIDIINSSGKVYLLSNNDVVCVGSVRCKLPGNLVRSRSFVTKFLSNVCNYFMLPEMYNFMTIDFDQNVSFDSTSEFTILIPVCSLMGGEKNFISVNVVPLVNLYSATTTSYKYYNTTKQLIFIDYSSRSSLMVYDLMSVRCIKVDTGARMAVRAYGESVSDDSSAVVDGICWDYDFAVDNYNGVLLSYCYLLFNDVNPSDSQVSYLDNYVFYGNVIATQLVDRLLSMRDVYLPYYADLSVVNVIKQPTYTQVLNDDDFDYSNKALNIMGISGIDLIHNPNFKQLFESLLRSFVAYFDVKGDHSLSNSIISSIYVVKTIRPITVSLGLGVGADSVNVLVYQISVSLQLSVLGNFLLPFVGLFVSFIETSMNFNTFFEVVFVDSATLTTIFIKRNFV